MKWRIERQALTHVCAHTHTRAHTRALVPPAPTSASGSSRDPHIRATSEARAAGGAWGRGASVERHRRSLSPCVVLCVPVPSERAPCGTQLGLHSLKQIGQGLSGNFLREARRPSVTCDLLLGRKTVVSPQNRVCLCTASSAATAQRQAPGGPDDREAASPRSGLCGVTAGDGRLPG